MSERVIGNGATPTKRAIYICQNEFCLEKGAEGYVEKLRQKVVEHRANLAAVGNSGVESVELENLDVKVRPYICFNGCDYGPIIILYPDCQLYACVTEADLDTIANAATSSSQPGGPEIERLQDNALDIDPDIRDAALFALKRKMQSQKDAT